MISGAKCTNHTKCNVCYTEYPNLHCNQCSFVLCNNCKYNMTRLGIDDKCSQCRKEKPWLQDYEVIPEFKKNRKSNFRTNIHENTNVIVNNKKCCKNMVIPVCIKRIPIVLTVMGLLILFGYIISLINGTNSEVKNSHIVIRLSLYLITGVIVCLLGAIIFLMFALCGIACCKQGTPESRIV